MLGRSQPKIIKAPSSLPFREGRGVRFDRSEGRAAPSPLRRSVESTQRTRPWNVEQIVFCSLAGGGRGGWRGRGEMAYNRKNSHTTCPKGEPDENHRSYPARAF